MKPFGLLLLVAASAGLATNAFAATRPRYGGILRVAVREAPASLDPAGSDQLATFVSRSLSRLIFDTLVILDSRGQPRPALSSSWQAEPGNQRWRFNIRHGIAFHDGTGVSSDAIAASLRAANPNWKVFATGDAVVIESEVATPNLPAILALPRYGIAKRSGGSLTGSGPFAINHWEPAKKLTLVARDDYWGGRTFVDAIEIEMNKSFREQMITLDLGKADVVEVPSDQSRHAVLEGRHIETSLPAEWMALVFTRDNQSEEDKKLHEALAFSIDRDSMNSVLLQGGGESAGSLLPNWMTGYAFLFPMATDLARARQLRGEVHQPPSWILGYDTADSLARVIAERIVLNARDAGLTLQPTNSATVDVRLVRLQLASLDPRVALTTLASGLGLPQPKFDDDTVNDLYLAESALLQSQRMIPLVHLRTAVATSPNVRDWLEDQNGDWQLQNVWLDREKP